MEDVPYGRILREGWLIILLAALIGAGAAYGVAKLLPETYTATSGLLLQVDSTEASLFERNQFSLARIKTYPALVDSPSVIEGVREELGLSADDYTDRDIRRMLSAENTADTVLLAVRADAPTAKLAADLANAAAANLSLLIEGTENSGDDERYQVILEQVLPAVEPLAPTSPQVLAITGLGLIGGFALGAIVAVYRTTTSRRISTISDVRRASGLPVVGQIPRPSRVPLARFRKRAEAAADAAYADALNNLSTLGGRGLSRLLLVPVSEGGVDQDELNGLLEAYAAAGRRVGVLDTRAEISKDGDFRSLADALVARSAATAVASSAESGAVIYASTSPIPTATLERELPRAILRLAADFDIVLLVADPGASGLIEAAAQTGAHVLLSVRRNATSATELVAVATRLRVMGIRPLGVLITQAASRSVGAAAESWRESDRVDAVLVPGGPASGDIDEFDHVAAAWHSAEERNPASGPRESVAGSDRPGDPAATTSVQFADDEGRARR